MPKKNADALVETADVLLARIREEAGRRTNPEHLKDLAQAYALIAANDVVERSGSGCATVL